MSACMYGIMLRVNFVWHLPGKVLFCGVIRGGLTGSLRSSVMSDKLAFQRPHELCTGS